MKHYTILRNDVYCGTTGTLTGNTPSYWDVELEMHDGSRGYYDLGELSEVTKVLQVKLKKLTPTAVIPKYATEGSACFDLCADEDIIVEPGCTLAISIGLAFELPKGYQMKVLPRSGLSVKTPLRVVIGTVDSDYRLEVKVIMWHTGKPHFMERNWCKSLNGKANTDEIVNCNAYKIFKGDRIAQAEVVPITQVSFEVTDILSETKRTGGFGSTGIR